MQGRLRARGIVLRTLRIPSTYTNLKCLSCMPLAFLLQETVLRKARQEQVHNLVEQIEEYVKVNYVSNRLLN